jgi:hypothetical protein
MNPADYIHIGDLSERHQRALRHFVYRYRRGACEHGDLMGGRRWTPDMLEEQLDLSFYLLFELMEHEDSNAAKGESRDHSCAVREG